MMKRVLINCIAGILCCFTIHAQSPYAAEVFVVNSGIFEFSPPYQDYVTVGSYNIPFSTYTTFDTIFSQSALDILIDSNTAYIATSDSIVMYNLLTKERINSIRFPGISPNYHTMSVDQEYLYVGNWFGQTDSNLYAFNRSDLSLAFSVEEIDGEVGSTLVVGDTLYVGIRLKGSIDECPPFGCYNDSLGKIAVVDIPNQNVVRYIDLDTAGAKITDMMNHNGFIYALSPLDSTLTRTEIGTDATTTFSLNGTVLRLLSIDNDTLYMMYNDSLAYFDVHTEEITVSSIAAKGIDAVYDTISETVWATQSDYTSYGQLFRYTDNENDSIEVDVAPESIALYYRSNLGPAAIDDAYSFTYSDSISSYQLFVLNNDVDPDNDSLSITLLSNPQIPGASVDNLGSSIVYHRSLGIATTDVFTYTICDPGGLCDTAQVSILIQSITGISDRKIQTLQVWPNPVQNTIHVNERWNQHVYVFTGMDGRTVSTGLVENGQINISSPVSGMFVLEIKDDARSYRAKIVVQ